MSDIGQIERKTQNRVRNFRDQLGYDYAGNLEDAENSNVMVGLLTEHLHGCGYWMRYRRKRLRRSRRQRTTQRRAFMTATGRYTNCCVTA